MPIIDVSGNAEFGVLGTTDVGTSPEAIDADVYFACCDEEISRIQTFNTITNAWEQVPFSDDPVNTNDDDPDGTGPLLADADPLNDPDLVFGHAYWVFATEAATLVP